MIGIISYGFLPSSLNLTLGPIFETADAFALLKTFILKWKCQTEHFYLFCWEHEVTRPKAKNAWNTLLRQAIEAM